MRDWSLDVWNFGDTVVLSPDDGAADYPFLRRYETMRPGAQAAAYARRQTRLLRGSEEVDANAEIPLRANEAMSFRLDTNGLAEDDQAPAPTCFAEDARAETNYNGVTVFVRAEEAGSVSLSEDCMVEVGYASQILEGGFALFLSVTAKEESLSRAYYFTPPFAIGEARLATVAADALDETAVLTLFLTGDERALFRAAAQGGFRADGGGRAATVSLTAAAVALFTLDELALPFALTASDGDQTTVRTDVQFVSSARGFNGAERRRVFSSDLNPGDEVFAAAAVSLTIWHSPNGSEFYTLEGEGADLFGASDAGAVTARNVLSAGLGDSYKLTLVLNGGGATSRRGLLVELSPSLSDGGDDLSGVDGATVTVRADARAGENVWALSLSGGSSLSSFAENGFSSEGGSLALISLSAAAVDLFTLDGLTLSLTLTAENEGEERGTATVSFVSAARGFMGEALTASFVAEVLSLGVEVFGSSSVSLTIWHNRGGEEEYELLGSDAGLFTVGADGGVSVKEDLRPLDAIRYELTLALSGGGTVAHRELIVRLSPFPGSPFIYTDDEEEGDGSAENPFLIYDLYQLQWINGALPEAAWDFLVSFYEPYKSREDLETIAGLYFTGAADTNLDSTVHYRLANDIDATPTRQWQNGFASIGGAQSFNGSFDGDGREIRGLFARNADGGLFSQIGAGGTAQSLYLRDVDIEAETAGSFAGTNRGRISRAGATGRVVGETAGGLAGDMAGEMIESWFVGEVEGELFGGGVSGIAEGLHRNNWAMARVTANSPPGGNVGGYAGQITNAGGIEDSWAGGEESGFFGNRTDEQSVAGYFDRATAGRLDIETITETSLTVFSVDTMATVTNTAWSTAAWNFGKIVAGENNAADYPFLSGFEDLWPGRQALAFADFQTRLLTSDGIVFAGAALSPGERLTLVLDANGLASDDGATPVAQCEDDGAGGIVASANYNEVTIGLRAAAPGILSRVSDSPISDCEFVVGYAADAQAPAGSGFFMLMTIAAGEASLSRSYPFLSLEDADGDFWRGDLDSDGIPNAYDLTPSAEFPVDLFFGADGTAERPWPIYNVWHLQAIDGERVGIIGGLVSDSAPDNAAIAIFGDSDAERLGAHYRLMADIDASPTRAWSRAEYALGFQPLGWRSAIFHGSFDGQGREIRNLFMRRGISGAGRFSTDHGINAGLFAVVGAGATVRNLGLLDVDFRSDEGQFIGGLAGKVSVGLVSLVWATGVVEGEETIGGLAGLLEDGGEIVNAWFVGKVAGIEETGGGLVGESARGSIRDSWALAELSRGETSSDPNPIGGLIGRNGSDGVLDDSWAIGLPPAEEGAGLIGDNRAQVSVRRAYWDRSSSTVNAVGGVVPASVFSVDTMATVTDADAEWSTAAWNFGKVVAGDNNAADYPFLRGAEGFWPGRQAVAFANFQTRLLTSDDETFTTAGLALSPGERLTLTLDANGLAPNDAGQGATPVAQCEDDGAGGVVARANYNEVTIVLRAAAPGTLSDISADCGFVVGYTADADAPAGRGFLMMMTIATGQLSVSRAYPFLSLEDASGDFWRGDLDGDRIVNAYDRIPSSEFPVDLFYGVDGSAERPWPIYNVWHLQAIGGVEVSPFGEYSDGYTLFGASADVRLSSHYRVAAEIDATPTREMEIARGD